MRSRLREINRMTQTEFEAEIWAEQRLDRTGTPQRFATLLKRVERRLTVSQRIGTGRTIELDSVPAPSASPAPYVESIPLDRLPLWQRVASMLGEIGANMLADGCGQVATSLAIGLSQPTLSRRLAEIRSDCE